MAFGIFLITWVSHLASQEGTYSSAPSIFWGVVPALMPLWAGIGWVVTQVVKFLAQQHRRYRLPLGQFFLEAEDAYLRYLSKDECGTISLEPLVGNRPGPPVYLRDRLKPEQRAAYTAEMERLSTSFAKLQPNLQAKDRSARVAACLAAVRKDLEIIR